MTPHAVIAISRHSAGSQAFTEALQRAGYTTEHRSLLNIPHNHTTGTPHDTIHIDRSLPPYLAPMRTWTETWWNRPDHAWNAWSKTYTSHTSARHGLAHPRTIAFDAQSHHTDPQPGDPLTRARAALEYLGGKAVAKLDRGLMGDGVTLVSTPEETLTAMQNTRHGVLQEYIPAGRTTLRVVCARGTVIAAYARVSAPEDWRGNVAAGATVTPVTLDTQEEQLAAQAMRAFALDFAGIDIIRTDTGPVFLEANPAFGVAGLLRIHPHAIDYTIEVLQRGSTCTCGSREPHDASSC